MPVSDKHGPQLTPGVEQHLVDRVAAGAELEDQGIQRDTVEHDRDGHLPLPRGQHLVHGAAPRPGPATRPAARGRDRPGPAAGPSPRRPAARPDAARSAGRSWPTPRRWRTCTPGRRAAGFRTRRPAPGSARTLARSVRLVSTDQTSRRATTSYTSLPRRLPSHRTEQANDVDEG